MLISVESPLEKCFTVKYQHLRQRIVGKLSFTDAALIYAISLCWQRLIVVKVLIVFSGCIGYRQLLSDLNESYPFLIATTSSGERIKLLSAGVYAFFNSVLAEVLCLFGAMVWAVDGLKS